MLTGTRPQKMLLKACGKGLTSPEFFSETRENSYILLDGRHSAFGFAISRWIEQAAEKSE